MTDCDHLHSHAALTSLDRVQALLDGAADAGLMLARAAEIAPDAGLPEEARRQMEHVELLMRLDPN
jgi:hypothetical protein